MISSGKDFSDIQHDQSSVDIFGVLMSVDDFAGQANKTPKLTLQEINKELDLLIRKKQDKEVTGLFTKNQRLQIKKEKVEN